MRVCAVDLDGVLARSNAIDPEDLKLWWEASVELGAVSEIKHWAWNGWVIAILTSRPRELRALTEMWLTKKEVPYSSFLVDVLDDQWGELCRNLDAAFLVTDDMSRAMLASSHSRVYVVKHFPTKLEKESAKVGDIEFVTGLSSVTKKEKKL